MINARIKAIKDAATILFLQQGYSKTQIKHIAEAVGVSVGTIYHDFVGKEEIMHFVLKCTIEPGFADREFETPITDRLFTNLEEELIAVFEENAKNFAKNLDKQGEAYGFEQLISDAFDLLAQYAVGCLFIEKNQYDFPSLAQYYKGYRKQFFETMKQYIEAFIEMGTVRLLEHVALSTNVIIEILTWWAMDRRFVSFEACDIPMELAKEVCMDNILTAYQK